MNQIDIGFTHHRPLLRPGHYPFRTLTLGESVVRGRHVFGTFPEQPVDQVFRQLRAQIVGQAILIAPLFFFLRECRPCPRSPASRARPAATPALAFSTRSSCAGGISALSKYCASGHTRTEVPEARLGAVRIWASGSTTSPPENTMRCTPPSRVLDPEIALWSAGVMAGGKDDTAESLQSADHAGSRRCRKDAPLPDQRLAEPVGCRNFEYDLDRFSVVVAPVATDHQECCPQGLQWYRKWPEQNFQDNALPEKRLPFCASRKCQVFGH